MLDTEKERYYTEDEQADADHRNGTGTHRACQCASDDNPEENEKGKCRRGRIELHARSSSSKPFRMVIVVLV